MVFPKHVLVYFVPSFTNRTGNKNDIPEKWLKIPVLVGRRWKRSTIRKIILVCRYFSDSAKKNGLPDLDSTGKIH